MKKQSPVYVNIGDLVTMEIAYSECCMYMQVAGRVMQARLIPRGDYWPAAQLYLDGREFSAPITPGEAGFYYDSERKQFYYYPAEPPAAQPAEYRDCGCNSRAEHEIEGCPNPEAEEAEEEILGPLSAVLDRRAASDRAAGAKPPQYRGFIGDDEPPYCSNCLHSERYHWVHSDDSYGTCEYPECDCDGDSDHPEYDPAKEYE